MLSSHPILCFNTQLPCAPNLIALALDTGTSALQDWPKSGKTRTTCSACDDLQQGRRPIGKGTNPHSQVQRVEEENQVFPLEIIQAQLLELSVNDGRSLEGRGVLCHGGGEPRGACGGENAELRAGPGGAPGARPPHTGPHLPRLKARRAQPGGPAVPLLPAVAATGTCGDREGQGGGGAGRAGPRAGPHSPRRGAASPARRPCRAAGGAGRSGAGTERGGEGQTGTHHRIDRVGKGCCERAVRPVLGQQRVKHTVARRAMFSLS